MLALSFFSPVGYAATKIVTFLHRLFLKKWNVKDDAEVIFIHLPYSYFLFEVKNYIDKSNYTVTLWILNGDRTKEELALVRLQSERAMDIHTSFTGYVSPPLQEH